MKFLMHRDKTVPTRQGHTIEFKKGVLTHVPPECYDEVIAVGAVPETEIEDTGPTNVNEPTDAVERKAKIMAAFEAIATENTRDSFSANGVPTLDTVFQKIGFKIDPKERDTLWVEYIRGDEAEVKARAEADASAKVAKAAKDDEDAELKAKLDAINAETAAKEAAKAEKAKGK